MDTVVHNTDVAVRPLLRFSQQFLNTDSTKPYLILKQNLESLVRIFADELQELEDTLFVIFRELDLSVATGASLDVIAKVVGAAPRQGMLDDDYRQEIELQIAINTSNGNVSDVINAVKRITKSTIVSWVENAAGQPAYVDFVVNGSAANQSVLDRITQILSAAVGFGISYRDDAYGVFDFSDVPTTGGTVSYYPDEQYWRAFSDVYPASVVNGSPNVTISATHDLLGVAGDTIYFDGNLSTPYVISGIAGTALVLTTNYTGTTNANGVLYVSRNTLDTSDTVQITNGSATVVVNDPANDLGHIQVGDTVFFNGEFTGYVVDSVSSPNIVLTAVYAGTTDTTATCKVVQHSGSVVDKLVLV